MEDVKIDLLKKGIIEGGVEETKVENLTFNDFKVIGKNTNEHFKKSNDGDGANEDQSIHTFDPQKLINSTETKEDRRKASEAVTQSNIKTGFKELDSAIPFNKGTVTSIMAKTGSGKTTFMLNVMDNIVESKPDTACIFASYEATPISLKMRLVNILYRKHSVGHTLENYRENGDIQYNDFQDIPEEKYSGRFSGENKNIYLLQSPSFEDIESLIDALLEINGSRDVIVFLDYIQLMSRLMPNIRGYEKIKEVMMGIEKIASRKGKEVVIFVGSQVNKEGDPREGEDILFFSSNALEIMWHGSPTLGQEILDNKDAKETKNNKTKFSRLYTAAMHKSKIVNDEKILSPISITIKKARTGLTSNDTRLESCIGFDGTLMECMSHINKETRVKDLFGEPKENKVKKDSSKRKRSEFSGEG